MTSMHMRILILVAAGLVGACGGGGDSPQDADVTNGLVAWWPGDGNLMDVIGGANAAATGGFDYAADRFGNANGAWDFNGVDAKADVATPPALFAGADGLTISFWHWTSAFGYIGPIIHTGLFGCHSNVAFTMISGSTNTVTSAAALSTWSHYVCTYDRVTDEMRIYRDGVLQDSDLKGDPLASLPFSFINFGWSNWPIDAYFVGRLDDIRFYDRVLSAAEVAQLHAHQSAN